MSIIANPTDVLRGVVERLDAADKIMGQYFDLLEESGTVAAERLAGARENIKNRDMQNTLAGWIGDLDSGAIIMSHSILSGLNHSCP